MMKQTAQSDSARRSEQLSCFNFFDPSYGLKVMNFQSLFEFLEFIYFIKSNIIQNSACDVSMTSL
jgi:hypothetical protein